MNKLDEALTQPKQELVGDEWTPCIKLPVVVHVRQQHLGETHVSTREGITPVRADDLIMRGVEGEEYPIGRVLFLKTYTFDTSPPERQPLTRATIADARDFLNTHDKAMWVIGWNECVEAHGIGETE